MKLSHPLFHPYYLVNIFLSFVFIVTKNVRPICSNLFDNCEVEIKEAEVLLFMLCTISIRGKRQVTLEKYVSHACMFAKLANLVMFYRHSWAYAIIYSFIWLLQVCLLRQPVYKGPEKTIFFREQEFREEVLLHSPERVENYVNGPTYHGNYWLIEFYRSGSPACIDLFPVFSELSQKYGLRNLQFGKLEIYQSPLLATDLKIDISSWSNQIPTLILFRRGREVARRPAVVASTGRVLQRFSFDYRAIVSAFDLERLHRECLQSDKNAKKTS